MLVIMSKLLLIFFGAIIQSTEISAGQITEGTFIIAAVLSAVTLTALNQYRNSKYFTALTSSAYFALSVFYPLFAPFTPLFCFDLFIVNTRKFRILSALTAVSIIIIPTHHEPTAAIFLVFLIALAAFMQYMCGKIDCLTEENKRIRDNGVELNRMLAEKNKNLIEKQNYEIHLATLKERNRIAREIHDNVGHILSRSILQTGALQSINKNEQVSKCLSELKDTLSLAMDSIRSSVHGLRDESVDLYNSIIKMTENPNYKINIDYDATQEIANEVKYCFLTVLKEALTNISRHSDASKIKISVQEHPAMYQFLIHDNGTKKPLPDKIAGSGMGLSNMEERVSALNGRFSASYQNGFRIFISIPKQEDSINEYDKNNNS